MTAVIDDYLPLQQRVDAVLRRTLQQSNAPPRLAAAMRYVVLNGGKRIRPLLAYGAAEAICGSPVSADIAAAAVEFIHAYSLVHDDLPAMDDDQLRRGKPTCHVMFDDATAILAGDALQALAFELLATSRQLSVGHATRLEMISILARASGADGMVGGQMIDMESEGMELDGVMLGRMHSLKTGALIRASIMLGALSTNLVSRSQLEKLRVFADKAGLAFQIKDDLLDVETESAISGKEQGKDADLQKSTYTSNFGIDGARNHLACAVRDAELALTQAGLNSEPLLRLLNLIANRHY